MEEDNCFGEEVEGRIRAPNSNDDDDACFLLAKGLDFLEYR
jgi:hypothetical protein